MAYSGPSVLLGAGKLVILLTASALPAGHPMAPPQELLGPNSASVWALPPTFRVCHPSLIRDTWSHPVLQASASSLHPHPLFKMFSLPRVQ